MKTTIIHIAGLLDGIMLLPTYPPAMNNETAASGHKKSSHRISSSASPLPTFIDDFPEAKNQKHFSCIDMLA